MKRSWYAFMGGDPFNVENYHRLTAKPGYLCGANLCAIYATGVEIHPLDPLSNNLRDYIKKGLETELLQPFDPFFTKKYVYLKDV
ncbi:hypothetical protein OQY15_01670 [Pedobacter sp. MC2016-15]|uniref:hypothetical protein n=1 Tax=Pedobacter sp. MC2016-15 TaxID=2994473 RepID=UPI00224688DD|nr:hypothetical protein [Pedobacter sp. MC2016-15]MCX2477777.1 hypothetical protein [Pedobacter sp. MC2016-15]